MDKVKENVRQQYNHQLTAFAVFGELEGCRRCVYCLGGLYGLSKKDIEEDIKKAKQMVDEKYGGN